MLKYVGLLAIMSLFTMIVTRGKVGVVYSTDLVVNSLAQKLDEEPGPISQPEPIVKIQPLPKPKPIIIPKPNAEPANS